MQFGHVILEGYCDICNDSQEELPCKNEGRLGIVAHYCLIGEGKRICSHFGWCKASEYVVLTDKNGYDIKCKPYNNDKFKLIESILNEDV